ncbi:MAG: hypothetical protein AB7D39_12830 [Pseudodesulfovibrio sp.]|uniref:hypothetical protein n=1 Tax=Pseudodesulfovibrio sp. TaxID=2035812 RepID=UPI003D142539
MKEVKILAEMHMHVPSKTGVASPESTVDKAVNAALAVPDTPINARGRGVFRGQSQ